MTQQQKFLIALLSGQRDHNLSFASLTQLLENLGFNCRMKGSHRIFFKAISMKFSICNPLAFGKNLPSQTNQRSLAEIPISKRSH